MSPTTLWMVLLLSCVALASAKRGRGSHGSDGDHHRPGRRMMDMMGCDDADPECFISKLMDKFHLKDIEGRNISGFVEKMLGWMNKEWTPSKEEIIFRRLLDHHSNYCTTFLNEQRTWNVCSDATDTGAEQVPEVICDRCKTVRKCQGRRWWLGQTCVSTYTCNECCKEVQITKREILQKNFTVCCPGYHGQLCTKAICSAPCDDDTTTCTTPGLCGPACYPWCQNRGSCVAGVGGGANTCDCPTGYTGDRCEIRATCDNVTNSGNTCLNNGRCDEGQCQCPRGYDGARCEIKFCSEACMNGGVCDGVGSTVAAGTCDCSSAPGYTGPACNWPDPAGGAPIQP